MFKDAYKYGPANERSVITYFTVTCVANEKEANEVL